MQVRAVDGVPDPLRLLDRLVVGHPGVAGEVRRGVAEGGLAQPPEAVDVPAADVAGGRVDVDAEVEEVRDRQAGAAVVAGPGRLQHVEALDDHDVGALDHDLLVGDVVDEVGVDRRLDLVLAGLDVDDEPEQRLAVVGLREALALHQAAALELGVGEQEAVGGHQRDRRVLGPVREHLLQHPGGGRLADRHRAGQPDHERRARGVGAVEELLLAAVQPAGGLDVHAEQAGQREVDLLDLVEVELVTQAPQPVDLLGAERLRRRRRQCGPGGPVELDVRGALGAVLAPGGGGHGPHCCSHSAAHPARPRRRGRRPMAGGGPGAPLDSGPCAESWATSGNSRRRAS